MKALSVRQPWATVLVEGVKTIETRTWATPYRGPLVICASSAPKDMFWFDAVDKVHRLMHAGCIIGVVDLLDCRPMTEDDEDAAMCDLYDGAYAWVMKTRHFCRPDRVVGRLGLFDIPDDKLVPIANDDTDWLFNYPPPQGAIKYTDKRPVFE